VWRNPASAFVARFLGLGNVIEGEVRGRMASGKWKVENSIGMFTVGCEHKHSEGDKVHLLTRPLSAEKGANVIKGVVTDVIFQQDRYKVTLDNGLYVYLQEAPEMGEKIEVRIKVECLA